MSLKKIKYSSLWKPGKSSVLLNCWPKINDLDHQVLPEHQFIQQAAQYLFMRKHCSFACALNNENKITSFWQLFGGSTINIICTKSITKSFFWHPVMCYLWTMIFSSLISLWVTPSMCKYPTASTTCLYIGLFFTKISEMTNYKIHLDICVFFLVFDSKWSKI